MRTRFVVGLGFATALGCGAIREAPVEGEAAPGDDAGVLVGSGDDAGASATDAATDARKLPPEGAKTWAEAQTALAALRFPGPLTAQGSRGACAPSHFVWRDQDGAMHAWSATTKTRIDYAFTSTYRPFFAPSDAYVVVDAPPSEIAAYATPSANALVKKLPYAYGYAGATDSVVLLEQVGGTASQVRKWVAATDKIESVTQASIPTLQPPSAFAYDQLVVPGSVNVPHPLYIVDVAKKTTTSVTFDGGLSLYAAKPTPEGLLVSYARSGPVPALRVYKKNLDTPASRFELGDELATTPPLFADSPANEHKFLVHVDYWKGKVVFDSAFGIFAYDLATSKLSAVQLGPDKTAYVPDTLCVMEAANLLAFRMNGDANGQVWLLPLDQLP